MTDRPPKEEKAEVKPAPKPEMDMIEVELLHRTPRGGTYLARVGKDFRRLKAEVVPQRPDEKILVVRLARDVFYNAEIPSSPHG